MKKQKQTEKKLSLKKLQITKLNMIRGGDGDIDTMTGGDTTNTSKNCNSVVKATVSILP
ncbi:hypothetical protein [Chryseobacterium sp. Hurlbut01]|uniref:hypothetical protein n=1 Tax=Chryseobacterium sp. Hurlbut01 TaxID=1681828 RepID=UPI000A9E951A|nr:hypothetical protein [Chryseobacterium sp. Hurlbut01]